MDDGPVDIWHGDCLEVLRTLPAASCDSLVTDPPAGIAFMGKAWDGHRGGRAAWVAWLAEVMGECLRVLKPGAHGLVWALPRTQHWTMCALEDAGFEVRDVIVHLFGTGFPKSLDVGKAIDKAAGAERAVIGSRMARGMTRPAGVTGDYLVRQGWAPDEEVSITAPATDEARRWDGWGTALKPGHEAWILVRKPLAGTVAGNVLAHGTGALNIDACRIGYSDEADRQQARVPQPIQHNDARGVYMAGRGSGRTGEIFEPAAGGRWPANVVLSQEAAVEVDTQSGASTSPSGPVVQGGFARFGTNLLGTGGKRRSSAPGVGYGDTGGASRFFYCAKAPASERPAAPDGTRHPTVKALALMRWLLTLVTPPGGVVLDPFAGSGATGEAAVQLGMAAVLIEAEESYLPLIEQRVERAVAI